MIMQYGCVSLLCITRMRILITLFIFILMHYILKETLEKRIESKKYILKSFLIYIDNVCKIH